MKKTAAILLAMMLCLGAVGAQALTMTGLETETVSRDWSEHKFFARMEALTGVPVQAYGVTDEVQYAQMLADMERGDISADVLFKANLTRAQEIALSGSGALIDLAPMIDEHMPNLSGLLAAHPEWKESIALDDGRIVSLPLLNSRERQVMVWINKAWLDKLGIAMPGSMDELTAALEAFREKDPNGNYKQDEIAADLTGVFEMRWLLPYFGVVADDYNLARNAQGEIVFAPEMPEYRAFIECLADWTARGILPRAAFTAAHSAALLDELDENAPVTSGMIVSMTPYTVIPVDAVEQYEALLMPAPDGKTRWRDFLGCVWPGCFAVTSACDNPAEALKWVDALYSEEGALLAYGGVEGEDYLIGENGLWSFNTSTWRDVNSFRSEILIYTGIAAPGLYPSDFVEHVDSAPDQHVFAANTRVHAVAERVTQPYCLTTGAQTKADALALELGELVDVGIARFATGEVELNDATYAAWLDELKAAGSAELAALFADAQ